MDHFNISIPRTTKIYTENYPTPQAKQLDQYFESVSIKDYREFDEAIIPVISFLIKKSNNIESHVFLGKKIGDHDEKSKSIYRILKRELVELFCKKGSKYSTLQKKFDQNFEKAVIVISGYISGATGLEIGLVLATVSISLKLMVKIGVNVWCEFVA